MAEYKVHRIRYFNYVPEAINSIAFDDRADKIAVSRAGGSIEIWDIKHDWFQEKILPGSDHRSVEDVAWCGDRLFSAGMNGDISEYDLDRCQVKHSADSYGGAVWSIKVNNSRTHLAAGCEDGCIRLYNLSEDNITFERSFDKVDGRILCLCWSRDDSVIVSGSSDVIRVWSVANGRLSQHISVDRLYRNKENIIWSVIILSDLTIVSGDSNGRTQFWNGKYGTLLSGFKSHKADVQTVCVSKDEKSVYSAGIDPKIVQFNLVPSGENSQSQWVRANSYSHHTHDIRSLCVVNDQIVSGGVDTKLAVTILSGNQQRSIDTVCYHAIPQNSLVSYAKQAKLVLLQCKRCLELWTLGESHSETGYDGQILNLSEKPCKLLLLETKGTDDIVCSSVSNDGSWLAYSDANKLRLFKLTVQGKTQVSVKKVRLLIDDEETGPCRCLLFTDDSTHLIVAMNNGRIHIVKLDTQNISTDHIDSIETQGTGVAMLAFCQPSACLAVADFNGFMKVYKTTDHCKLICTLPHKTCQPCSMCFNPNTENLLVVFTDNSIVEYDVTKCAYTAWSRTLSKSKLPTSWTQRSDTVRRVTCDPSQVHRIFVNDTSMFCIIDQTKDAPRASDVLFSTSKKPKTKKISDDRRHAFTVCERYQLLLYADIVDEGKTMVIVERPPLDILKNLPPSLQQRKFGAM